MSCTERSLYFVYILRLSYTDEIILLRDSVQYLYTFNTIIYENYSVTDNGNLSTEPRFFNIEDSLRS